MSQDGEPRELQATSADPAADPAGPPALSAGAVLAERFRIVRFVARGGMGELYEAEDLELGERVALKTILPSIAARPSMLDRFRREVHLARRVTHPNVCRTYDLFHHREGSSDIAFVTMEFLEGETLADLLRRRKRLEPAEALPIAVQIAGALTAAHAAGVVHRDLKAGNVLLVPGDSDGKTRAVVTDFGLAVPAREELGTGTLTATGHFVGTPAYMAPEQVEGGPITQATDVYAFGILLYEMMTGALPFEGGSPLAVAARRLNTDAPSPRSLRPDLDPLWEAVIVRCLKRSPDERFSSVAEVSRSLTEGTFPKAPPSAGRRWLAVGVGVAAVAAIAYGVISSRKGGPVVPPHGASGGARPAVAVLGFRNLSGQPDVAWLSTAFSEMLTTELGAGGKLRTIPGETVARMKVDLGLPDADSYAKDTLARVRSNLGSDAVVFGSFLAVGEGAGRKIRIDLRVQNASAAEAVQVASESGTEGELLDLVARAGGKLRDSLAAGAVSSADLAGTRAALPATSEAARLYAEGIAKIRIFDPLAAKDLLTRAVAADPRSALAHSALSSAWTSLGYDKTAAEEARKAYDLSSGLSREARLQIEGRLHETEKDWNKAIESYRTLFGFFPDNLEYGLQLASDQLKASGYLPALETIRVLRALPPPSRDDPRIDLLEGRAENGRGDFQRGYDASVSAIRKARERGAGLIAAQALRIKWSALLSLGKPVEAQQAAAEAREIYTAAGDRAGVASSLGHLGYSRFKQGDLDGAEALYRQALEIDRAIGNQSAISEHLNYLATLQADRKDYAGARKAYEESLRFRREVRDVVGVAGSLGNIANILQYEGDLEGSRGMHEESLRTHRELGDERGVAIELTNIGIILGIQGKFEEASTRFDEALSIKRRLANPSSIAFTLMALGEMQLNQGRLTEARASVEEALAIRKKLEEGNNAKDSELDLAQIAVEDGHLEEAIRLTSALADGAAKERDGDREGSSRTMLALALLAKRDVAGARREARTARKLLAGTGDVATRLFVTTTWVRVETASGAAGTALRREIDRAIDEAGKNGLLAFQLEARIARIELLAASGDSAAARAEASQTATFAKARGFGLAARKAEALAR